MIQEKISISKQIQFLSLHVHLHVHMRTGMCECVFFSNIAVVSNFYTAALWTYHTIVILPWYYTSSCQDMLGQGAPTLKSKCRDFGQDHDFFFISGLPSSLKHVSNMAKYC